MQGIDANPPSAGRDVIQQTHGNESIVEDEIGSLQQLDGTQRQQARIAGSGADKGHGINNR